MSNELTVKNNIISDLCNLNYENLKFTKNTCKIANTDLTYDRINISLNNEDGTISDLLIELSDCFSFGVSENKNMINESKTNGYTFPISLYQEKPSEKIKQWIESFNKLCSYIKSFLLKNKKALGLPDINVINIEKLNPLAGGNPLKAPKNVLYTKLIMNKSKDKIMTIFVDKDGNDIDGFKLLNTYCNCDCLLKIEYIYISEGSVALQIKLYEAYVQPVEQKLKRMMRR